MKVKLTIKELTPNEAFLRFEDGHDLKWPVAYLPKEIKVGDILTFSIDDSGSEKEPEQLAKDLLNEILNIN